MSQVWQYYLHDEPDAFRLELSGSLSGEGARSVYQAWRTAISIIGQHPVIVDITYVVDADERGRALLGLWRRRQARIVAGSPQSRALAEAILAEPYPEPSGATGGAPAGRGVPAQIHRKCWICGTRRSPGPRPGTSAAENR
jgi:hypothetical protein